jgi:hypothetical protein
MHSDVLGPPLHDFKKTVTVETGILSSKLYTNSHFHCLITVGSAGNYWLFFILYAPFVIAAIALIHLLFLHQTGSNNPLGLNKNTDKIPFHPYFTVKDIVGFAVTIILLTTVALKETYILRDPVNF